MRYIIVALLLLLCASTAQAVTCIGFGQGAPAQPTEFEIIGTTTVLWGTGAAPAAQNISIPSGTTAVYVFWSYWAAGTNGLNTATLDSSSPSATKEVETVTDYPAAGVAVWYNPGTGTKSLAITWDASPSEGPSSIIAFVGGGDTTSWRDADAQSHPTDISFSIDSSASDLILKYERRYGGAAPVEDDHTLLASMNQRGDYATLTVANSPGVATTPIIASNENYSAVVAVSIQE